eukprot:SAG31_NODE_5925_length_2254_cov_2.642691_2_plen_95_part_00
MVDIPFAVGEEFSSKWQFQPYIERGIIEFARLDLGNVGGFTEAMKVAGQCEAHYIDMMPHNREYLNSQAQSLSLYIAFLGTNAALDSSQLVGQS